MQNASGKQCLIATSLLVVILVAIDADAKRQRENKERVVEGRDEERERGPTGMNDLTTKRESAALSPALVLSR